MDKTDPNVPPPGGPFRRALATRWRSIFALWFVGTAALGYLCYREFPPQYRASSILRVNPSETDLFNIRAQGELLDQFLNTQVSLITSPNILAAAGNNPKAAILPRIQQAGDVVFELRKAIQVGIIPNTYLIEVSMTGPSAQEAATLVNAVVKAFIESNLEWSEGMARVQVKNLENYLADLKNQSEERERLWKELLKRGGTGRKMDDEQIKIEAKRVENDLQRLDAQSRLDALDQLVGEKKIAEGDASPQRVELLTKVRAAEILEKALAEKLAQLRKRGPDEADAVEIATLQEGRKNLIGMQEEVNKQLEQIKFDSKGEARIRAVNAAAVPGKPVTGRLTLALAVVPFVAFLASLGLVGAYEGLAGGRRGRSTEGDFGPI